MSYSVYEKLCKLNNVKTAEVARATGIHPQTFSDWKKGKYTPKQDKLQKIADYFKVSLNYLTDGEMPESDTYYLDSDTKDMVEFLFSNPEYRTLFDTYRTVKPEDINFIKEMIERMGRE